MDPEKLGPESLYPFLFPRPSASLHVFAFAAFQGSLGLKAPSQDPTVQCQRPVADGLATLDSLTGQAIDNQVPPAILPTHHQ